MKRHTTGFTLLELMITVVIIAILAAIAMPTYKKYVVKSHVRSAMTDLTSLSLVVENLYQRNLKYVATTATDQDAQNYISTNNGITWTPAESANFTYTLNASATGSGTPVVYYTLKAVGKTGTINAGCTLTLNNTNTKTIADTSKGCGGLTSW
ncbi:prepilin-type N-terminal cleavage/methylation domain-containing protein [Acinetobacter sp. ANC 4641]|nr:type IV pilin protein [Acinetobacter sp. ANC 4641]TCB12390.1 prepilin-type N-terminal cleavage/methylation domain-containing protein [Acinetobacter sp. ANC 4641]